MGCAKQEQWEIGALDGAVGNSEAMEQGLAKQGLAIGQWAN
jgi:hypothetical protein